MVKIEKSMVSEKVWEFLEGTVAAWPRTVVYTWKEFTDALRAAEGVELWKAMPGRAEPDPPEDALDVVLPQGRIRFCNLVEVLYQIVLEEGRVFYAPTIFFRQQSPSYGLGNLNSEIVKAIQECFPRHRIVLPEAAQSLPVPPWVAVETAADRRHSVIMFCSEAKTAWEQFIALTPLVDK